MQEEPDISKLAGVRKDQFWFFHPEMRARVQKAEVDFGAGRATVTRTPEDARVFLDGLKRRPRKRTKKAARR
jgi:hypothetical protein